MYPQSTFGCTDSYYPGMSDCVGPPHTSCCTAVVWSQVIFSCDCPIILGDYKKLSWAQSFKFRYIFEKYHISPSVILKRLGTSSRRSPSLRGIPATAPQRALCLLRELYPTKPCVWAFGLFQPVSFGRCGVQLSKREFLASCWCIIF